MINYDTHRQVRVSKDRGGSILTLVKATDDDSGNYTCSPYNVRPDSVSVHVLKETGPAEASVDDNASGSLSIISIGSHLYIFIKENLRKFQNFTNHVLKAVGHLGR